MCVSVEQILLRSSEEKVLKWDENKRIWVTYFVVYSSPLLNQDQVKSMVTLSVRVKLSLSTPRMHIEGLEVQLRLFAKSALDLSGQLHALVVYHRK